ncbi:MAG: DUF6602 domain-containing protein [Candidatus Njordarchaeales archaeon]
MPYRPEETYRPEKIIMHVERIYLRRLKELIELRANPNIKGQDIELAVKEFMETYLGSIFDFHNRVALVDSEGKYYEVLSPSENEFDVVATYRTAVPRIVIKIDTIKYIPLDAVAFIIEAKQNLTKESLEHSLQKFSKLSKLPISRERISVALRGPNTLDTTYIPKIILSIHKKISDESLASLLATYRNSWDIITITSIGSENVSNSILILNSKLPIVKRKEMQYIALKGFALTRLMCLLLTLLPLPLCVNASSFFFRYLFR